jgi:hypothetical protein
MLNANAMYGNPKAIHNLSLVNSIPHDAQCIHLASPNLAVHMYAVGRCTEEHDPV